MSYSPKESIALKVGMTDKDQVVHGPGTGNIKKPFLERYAKKTKSNIERLFKNFKNPYHHAGHTQFHWTDQKVKIHTFICLSGLLLSQFIWKKAREAGYSYSIETLLDKLTEVRQAEIVSLLTGFKGKPSKEVQLEEMDPELLKLYQDLDK